MQCQIVDCFSTLLLLFIRCVLPQVICFFHPVPSTICCTRVHLDFTLRPTPQSVLHAPLGLILQALLLLALSAPLDLIPLHRILLSVTVVDLVRILLLALLRVLRARLEPTLSMVLQFVRVFLLVEYVHSSKLLANAYLFHDARLF